MTKLPEVFPILRLQRTLRASAEDVFRSWTEPDRIRQWFSPDKDMATPIAEVDLRVGGRYRIGFQVSPDKIAVVGGSYVEIDRPNKLVFSWSWEPPTEHAGIDTLVTLTLEEKDGETELTLTHERIPDAEMANSHAKGWTGALDRLDGWLADGGASPA